MSSFRSHNPPSIDVNTETANDTSLDLEWCKIDRDGREESNSEDGDASSVRTVSAARSLADTRAFGGVTNAGAICSETTETVRSILEVLSESRENRARAAFGHEQLRLCSEALQSKLYNSDAPSPYSNPVSTISSAEERSRIIAISALLNTRLQQMEHDNAMYERLDAQLTHLTEPFYAHIPASSCWQTTNKAVRMHADVDDSDIPTGFPNVVMGLLERLGDLFILSERHAELEQTESLRARTGLSPESALDDTLRLVHSERLQDLEARHAAVTQEVERLREDCIAQGFDPDDPAWYESSSHPARINAHHLGFANAERLFPNSTTGDKQSHCNVSQTVQKICESTGSWDSAIDVLSEHGLSTSAS